MVFPRRDQAGRDAAEVVRCSGGWARRVAPTILSPLILAVLLGSCAELVPYDASLLIRQRMEQRLAESHAGGFDPGALAAAEIKVPFELEAGVEAEVAAQLTPARRDEDRVSEILGLIFERLDLEYALSPTRDASDTYLSREGNCLSFVHLFVAIARQHRLNPVYVEVEDYQRWRHRDGAVVSQGHIVAGLSVDGSLRTYDFLPYRPKTYRRTRVIDDLQAIAHHYNNLGAEALLQGDTEAADPLLRTAVALAPTFDKALNNLGVALARLGEVEGALELYEKGLGIDPDNIALLSNLAALELRRGRHEEAEAIFDRLSRMKGTSPFFFLGRGEVALARNDPTTALAEMTEALRRDSELPEVHLGLVRAFLALGEVERARHHLKRARNLDPSDDEARRLAEMLEKR